MVQRIPHVTVNNDGICRSCVKINPSILQLLGSVVTVSPTDPMEVSPLLALTK